MEKINPEGTNKIDQFRVLGLNLFPVHFSHFPINFNFTREVTIKAEIDSNIKVSKLLCFYDYLVTFYLNGMLQILKKIALIS